MNIFKVSVLVSVIVLGNHITIAEVIVPIENFTSLLNQHEIQLLLHSDGSKLGIYISKPDGLETFIKEITSSGEVKNLTGNFLGSPIELYEALKGALEKSSSTPATLILDLVSQALIYQSKPFNKEFIMIIKLTKVPFDFEGKLNYIPSSK